MCTQRDHRRARQDRVIVALESAGKADVLGRLPARSPCNIASANPQAVDPSGLDPAVVEREKNVLADKFMQQGKPANVIEKMSSRASRPSTRKPRSLEQPFIFRRQEERREQALKEIEGQAGGAIKVE